MRIKRLGIIVGALAAAAAGYAYVRSVGRDSAPPQVRNQLDCDYVAENRSPDFFWKGEAPDEFVVGATLERLPPLPRRMRLTGVLHFQIEQQLPTERWFVLSQPIPDSKGRRPAVFVNLSDLPPGIAHFATNYRDIIERCAVVEGVFVPTPVPWRSEFRGDLSEVQSLAVWSEPRENAPPMLPTTPSPLASEPLYLR